MRKEGDATLLEQLEFAYEALGEAIALAKKTNSTISNLKKQRVASSAVTSKSLDFSIPIRAFVKKYGNGLNGQKKFTLLIAYLTKGDAAQKVALIEVERQWNKMTAKGLLGMKFNRFYSSQARENDWVNMEKKGSYHLRPTWKEIFNA